VARDAGFLSDGGGEAEARCAALPERRG